MGEINLKISKLMKNMAAMEQKKSECIENGDFTAAIIAGITIQLYQRELDELCKGAAV